MKTTIPFISADLRTCSQAERERSGRFHSRLRRRRLEGGFTLIEMMVVVVIITILASIAVPGITRRMKMYNAKKDVESIAAVFRGARLRAMGRGSAVLVRFNDGVFTLHEGIQGTNRADDCATLPESNCLTPNRWDVGSGRSIQFDALDLDNAAGVTTTTARFINPETSAITTRSTLDICFTPLGNAYSDMTAAGTLTRMTTAPRFDLVRVDGVGFGHSALVTPLGTARVVATP